VRTFAPIGADARDATTTDDPVEWHADHSSRTASISTYDRLDRREEKRLSAPQTLVGDSPAAIAALTAAVERSEAAEVGSVDR
jgi:hypothetical protein